MAILTLEQLKNDLEYVGVFEERSQVRHLEYVYDYCSLIVRGEQKDSPSVTFLMDDKCTGIEYFSIGSWDDELFFGSYEVEDAVRLAKQFVHQ